MMKMNNNKVKKMVGIDRNKYVLKTECDRQHVEMTEALTSIMNKQDQTLILLRGDPKSTEDSGLVGEFQEMKGTANFDHKVLYSFIGIVVTIATAIAISLIAPWI
jgi:hypothetical protein